MAELGKILLGFLFLAIGISLLMVIPEKIMGGVILAIFGGFICWAIGEIIVNW